MSDEIVVRPIEDTDVGWVNASGVSDELLLPSVRQTARQLARWVDSARASRQKLTLFDRTAYAAPDNPYARMQIARNAVQHDDIVGGAADVLEGLAFQGIQWESSESDEADVFNQINADLDMDRQVRTWFREQYTYSQAIIGLWWGRKQYKVRGYSSTPVPVDPATGQPPIDPDTGKPRKAKRVRRKKEFDIATPVAMTFLDPMKVVPLAPGMFGEDRLAWHASYDEMEQWNRVQDELIVDQAVSAFFMGRPVLSMDERQDLMAMGVDPTRLLMLNPDLVFRHTSTRAPYMRFPDLRLASTFSLLDMKQQLMEADRVFLVGAANYILLVRKGTKEDPALPEELRNLNESMKVLAKLPVIIGDHRIQIDIITPDQSHVVEAERYDTLDRRILMRVLGSLSVTSSGQRNESTLTVARGVARLLESQRHMMKRTLERRIAKAVAEHPFNVGKFKDPPRLAYTPRTVQLDADSEITRAILALRTQKELSRESILEYFGFDQGVEADRRQFEEESGLDDIFQTAVPFDSPLNQGGRPPGGGESPQSPQGQSGARTSNGNPSTGS